MYLTSCMPSICRDPAGCIEILPGETIEIGIEIPTFNTDRSLALDIIAGVEIAIRQTPFIHGHPVRIIKEETTCLSKDQGELIARFAFRENLVGIIGPTCSQNADYFTMQLENAGLVVISPNSFDYSREIEKLPHLTPSVLITSQELISPKVAFIFNATDILLHGVKENSFKTPDGRLLIPRHQLRQAIFSTISRGN